MVKQSQTFAFRASALIITLMFIVLLGLEALVVGLILNRSMGTEAVLRGKNKGARLASEIMLNNLSSVIYADLIANSLTSDQILAKYKRGGTNTVYSTLTPNRYLVVNPESGINEPLGIDTASWIQEKRGDYYHLVARAKSDDVDIITHKWVLIKPCAATAGAATLTTILTGANYPGYNSTVVDPVDGRVFFGAAADSTTSSTSLYSWHTSTGLSTLASGGGIGNRSIHMASDGRVFFGTYAGSSTDRMYSWKSGVLSTLAGAQNGAGRSAVGDGAKTFFDTAGDRIYWGTSSGGSAYSWKDNLLSTIPNLNASGVQWNVALGGANELYYWATDGRFYRWTPSANTMLYDYTGAGLSSGWILSGVNTVTGRLFFTSSASPNKVYTYHSGTGLATLLNTASVMWFGGYEDDFDVWSERARYQNGRAYQFANSYMFFWDDTTAWSWNPSTPGSLSNLGITCGAGAGTGRGGSCILNPSKTMVTAGANSATATGYVWQPVVGLSTLPGSSNFSYPFEHGGAAWFGDLLFFGERRNPGRLYQWNASTQQLSTLMASLSNLGVEYNTVVDSAGTVFFGANTTSAGLFSFSAGDGLTTIVSGLNYPGVKSLSVSPIGGVYFGQAANPGNFYYYGPSSTGCSTRPY